MARSHNTDFPPVLGTADRTVVYDPNPIVTERTTCRVSGGKLKTVFDLGTPCVSDFLKPGEQGVRAPLAVAVSETWPHLPQLTHSYSPEAMYRRYHYRSGTNEAMRRELYGIVEHICDRKELKGGETWLDIACNDGTLLSWVYHRAGIDNLIGFDPSNIAAEGWDDNDYQYELVNDFFSAHAYGDRPRADVITCIAMFYDLEDPVAFCKDVEKVLADDGLFVLQLHYAPMMMKSYSFDAICHEHLAYWNIEQLEQVLIQAGLYIVDAELTASNGGSIRLYVMKADASIAYRKTVEGMVADERVANFMLTTLWRNRRSWEEEWDGFVRHTNIARDQTINFLADCKAKGKTVVGYGASTKGNTLLQYFGIGPDLLPCIAERQTHKHGLVTAGSSIPIISEEEMRRMKPDYLFVLPYHFFENFCTREAELLKGGTKLVAPLPKLRMVGG